MATTSETVELASRLAQRKAQQAELQASRRKIALAFQEVFGVEGSRTERQRLVWKNLMENCCWDASTTQNANPSTPIDPYWTHILEGRRQVALHVHHLLEEALQPPTVSPS